MLKFHPGFAQFMSEMVRSSYFCDLSDDELRILCKGAMKRKDTTREKSLEGIIEKLCSNNNREYLEVFVSHFGYLFLRLYFDDKPRIRQLCMRMLDHLASNVEHGLLDDVAPDIIGAWWLSCHDISSDVAASANNALQSCIPTSRIQLDYLNRILSHISPILQMTPETMKSSENDLSKEECEERFDRCQYCCMRGIGQLIVLSSHETNMQYNSEYETLLLGQKFWKKLQSKRFFVKCECFLLLSVVLSHFPDLLTDSIVQFIAKTIPKVLVDDDLKWSVSVLDAVGLFIGQYIDVCVIDSKDSIVDCVPTLLSHAVSTLASLSSSSSLSSSCLDFISFASRLASMPIVDPCSHPYSRMVLGMCNIWRETNCYPISLHGIDFIGFVILSNKLPSCKQELLSTLSSLICSALSIVTSFNVEREICFRRNLATVKDNEEFGKLISATAQINTEELEIIAKTLARFDEFEDFAMAVVCLWLPVEACLREIALSVLQGDEFKMPSIAILTMLDSICKSSGNWRRLMNNLLTAIMSSNVNDSRLFLGCAICVCLTTSDPFTDKLAEEFLLLLRNLGHVTRSESAGHLMVLFAAERILCMNGTGLFHAAQMLWKTLLLESGGSPPAQLQMIDRIVALIEDHKFGHENIRLLFDDYVLNCLETTIIGCIGNELQGSYIIVKRMLDSLLSLGNYSIDMSFTQLLDRWSMNIANKMFVHWQASHFAYGSSLLLLLHGASSDHMILASLLLSSFLDCRNGLPVDELPSWESVLATFSIAYDSSWDELITEVMAAICMVPESSSHFRLSEITILDLNVKTDVLSNCLIDETLGWLAIHHKEAAKSFWTRKINEGFLSQSWCLNFLKELVGVKNDPSAIFSEALSRAYHWTCRIYSQFVNISPSDELLIQLTELCMILESLQQANNWLGNSDLPSNKVCALMFRSMAGKQESPTVLKGEFKKLSGCCETSLFSCISKAFDFSGITGTLLFISCIESRFKMDVKSSEMMQLCGFHNPKIKLQQPKTSEDLLVGRLVLYVKHDDLRRAIVTSVHKDAFVPFATIRFEDGNERQTEFCNLYLIQDLHRIDFIEADLLSYLTDANVDQMIPYYSNFIDIGRMIVDGSDFDRIGIIMSKRAWRGLNSIHSWQYCMNLIPKIDSMLENDSSLALSCMLLIASSLISNISSPNLPETILHLTASFFPVMTRFEKSFMLMLLSIVMKSSWSDFGIVPSDDCWKFVGDCFSKHIVDPILLLCLSDDVSVLDYSVTRVLQVSFSNISCLVVEMMSCAEGTRLVNISELENNQEVEVESWSRFMLDLAGNQCEGILNLMEYAKFAADHESKQDELVPLSLFHMALSCYNMISSVIRFKLVLRSKGLMTEFEKQHVEQEERKDETRWKVACVDSLQIADGSIIVSEFLELVGLNRVFSSVFCKPAASVINRLDCLNWMIVCDFIDSVGSCAYLRASFSSYVYANPWVRTMLRFLVNSLSRFRNNDMTLSYDSVLSLIDRVSSFLMADITGDIVDEEEDQSIQIFLCCKALSRSISCLPSMIRKWHTNEAGRHEATLLGSYIENRSCQETMGKEMAMLRLFSRNGKLTESVKGSIESRQFEVHYMIDEVNVTLTIKVPKSFPLKNVEIQSSSLLGINEDSWRRWCLGITLMLSSQDGCIADAIYLWKSNVDKELEGIEACPICYSILDSLNQKSLPNMTCPTCHHKFHSSCLLQWFRSSGNNKCVMCRQPFYS